MGDNKKSKKQYSKPRHPWQKARIEYEKKLVQEYGLKNKQEVYKHDTLIKKIIRFYKQLNYQTTQQATTEQEQLLSRVRRLGYLPKEQDASGILSMTVENSLDRRLQTLVFKKGLARTVRQARQFITHQHILVNGKIVDAPGYIVPVSEEAHIEFVIRSPFVSEDHPERKIVVEEAESAPSPKKDVEDSKEATSQSQDDSQDVTPVEISDDSEDVETVKEPAKEEVQKEEAVVVGEKK